MMPPRVLASGPKPCGGKNTVLLEETKKESNSFKSEQAKNVLNYEQACKMLSIHER